MTKRLQILVLAEIEPKDRERLMQAAPGADFSFGEEKFGIADADIILGQPKPELLRNAAHLKWLQLSWAGAEPYVMPGILPEHVLLTNVTGAFGLAISEHMLASALMLTKKLHLYRDNMRQAVWLDRGNVDAIEGSVVLTVGLGDIGGNFARRMKALGAHTIGIRRTEAPKPAYMDEVYLSDRLDDVLPRADIVALALPGTALTRGLFDEARLSRMKKTAILINVGRGNAVDCMALAKLLNEGQLGGCSLDVTDPEPLPPEHPLWRCENALITPHISGFYHVRRTYETIVDIFEENLRRYLAGKPLIHVVDPMTGYCRKD